MYEYKRTNGTPLQYSCLENPRDRGAWWASIYGVAQSRTQLKRLSSSSSRAPGWLSKKEFYEWLIMSSMFKDAIEILVLV